MVVYFIATADRRYVKIGYTGGDMTRRLRAVRMGNPEPLELLGTLDGTKADEKDWHQAWRRLRVEGEWFRLTPELAYSIEWQLRPAEPEALF